jgi:hypothetical protein
VHFRPHRQRSTLVLRRLQGLYATTSITYRALPIFPMQVWMIPSHCLSALSSPPPMLGSHPLVPMKYQQMATKVINHQLLCDAFTSYVIFQVFTFQANSKWISGFNVRSPPSLYHALIRTIILFCVWSLDGSQILGGAFNLLQVIAAGSAAERMRFLM